MIDQEALTKGLGAMRIAQQGQEGQTHFFVEEMRDSTLNRHCGSRLGNRMGVRFPAFRASRPIHGAVDGSPVRQSDP